MTHRYTYTDCAGHDSVWSYVYTVNPDVFIEQPDETSVVHCVTDIIEPSFDGTPSIPVFMVCGVEYRPVLTLTENNVNEQGCGDSTFTYTYTINAVTHSWSYTYHVTPEPFSLPNDEGTTVECLSEVTIPESPEVRNSCNTMVVPTLHQIDTIWGTPGCEGTVTFVYRYQDCAGAEDFWRYTYTIDRSTPPSERGTPVINAATVACMDDAVLPSVLPEMYDVCDNLLVPVDTVVTENYNNCNGSRTYSFTYRDCSGLESQWDFTYTVRDTIRPEIGSIAPQEAIAAGNCQFRMPNLKDITLAATSDNCGHTVSFVSQSPDTTARFAQNTHDAQNVNVTVTVADECGNQTTSIIQVHIPASNINVTASNDVSICLGESTTLIANGRSDNIGGTVQYNWLPGTGLDRSDAPTVVATPADTTTYTVTATDENGCRDTDAVTVIVFPLAEISANDLEQTVCAGASITPINIRYTHANIAVEGIPDDVQYDFMGTGYGRLSGIPHYSGNFTITATNLYGCPTVTKTGTVTVNDTLRSMESVTACDTYTWATDGGTYGMTGVYHWNTVTAAGCDSVAYLDLTINHKSFGTETVTACDSYIWTTGNGQTYTVSTEEPTHLLPNGNAAGCDSTVTLHLTIHYSNATDDYRQACDSYIWNGTTFTQDTNMTRTLQNQWQCDSVVTLHLTIHPSYRIEETDSLCEGEIYTWHGEGHTTGGNFTHTYQTVYGCDSLYALHLVLLPTLTVEIEKDIDCIQGWYDLSAIATPPTHGDAFRYQWSSKTQFGHSTPQGTDSVIHVNPGEETTYYVSVAYGDNRRCPQTANITLSRFVKPTADITVNPPYVTPDNLRWHADYNVNGDRHTAQRDWYVDGQYYTQQTEHIYGDYDMASGNDSVIIELIAHSEQCADTSRIAIPYYFESLYLPNAFTPGLDINNLFGPVGTGIVELEMWVYNREGLIVFHSTDINEKWDGTHHGVPCPQAAYVYRINYVKKSMQNGPQTLVGTVMLLR